MAKKTIIITILISMLGLIAFAEPEKGVKPDNDGAKVKSPAHKGPMQRLEKWSNELKAAYEAKDMDKIGKLVEQMDNFKARLKKAGFGKKFRGDQDRPARNRKFAKGDRRNKRGMRQDRRDNDMPGWQNRQQEGQCQRPYAQKPNQQMGRRNRGRGDFGPNRRFNDPDRCPDMQRGFARGPRMGRGQGMAMRGWQRPQRQGRRYWQGRQGQWQRGFAGHMRGQRRWQQQNDCQRPMAMKRHWNCQPHQQMARGFGDFQQQRRPMQRRFKQFQGPCDQHDFRGPGMRHQNRKMQQKPNPADEWEW